MSAPSSPVPAGVRVRVPAKINLALCVGAPRDDGFHPLATVYQAVSLFGRLGNDTLTDSTFGDFLNGQGGADTINCTNGGTDTNVVDGADTVNGTCEF